MNTENLSTLKIHKLTQEQYDRELAAGRIDPTAIYLTPDEEIDVSGYATVDQVDDALDSAKIYTDSEIQEWVGDQTVATQIADAIVNKSDIDHTHTAAEIGADPVGSADNKVSAHNTSTAAHNDIRQLIDGLTTRLNTLANSDDVTLDQMGEVVAYIKNNKSLIDSVTTNKINVSDIINNLTTNIANKPLSAAQGVALKTLIDAITVPTKLSQLANDAGYLKEVPSQYITEVELDASLDDFGGTVEVTSGAPSKENTVMTLNPNAGETYIYTTDEVDQKFSSVNTALNTISEQIGDKQPKGNYLLSVPSEYVTETELTNKDYAIKSSLTLGKGSDGLVYLFVNGSPQGNGLEIKSDVVSGDVVGFVDDNNNIIITGALADGTYTLKYEDADGVQTEIGQLAVGATADINLLTIAVDSSGNPFIGTSGEIGYQTGYRIDNSGNYNAKEGMYTTGYIPVAKGDTIAIENMTYSFNGANGYRCKIVFYDANFTQLSGVAPATDISGYSPFYHNATSVSGVVSNGKFTLNDDSITRLSQFTIEQTGVAYMRLCVFQMDATSVIKKV